MARRKRLSDADLVEEAREARRHRTAAKAEEELAMPHVQRVADEMRARKRGSIELDGLRITFSESKRVLDLGRARGLLRQGTLRKVTKAVIVSDLWKAAMASGEITEADDVHCRVDQPTNPTVYVNPVKQAA